MTINDFEMPKTHPFGMCSAYTNANRKEAMLVYMLAQCIEAGTLNCFVPTIYAHEDMVRDGLLESDGTKTYKLTKKAIWLLYAYYGKEE